MPVKSGLFASGAASASLSRRSNVFPKDDRPREKLTKKGAEALSDLELMAILIGRGVEGHDVIAVAERVLTATEADRGKISIETPQKIEGVGPAKATQVRQCFYSEIGIS